MSLTVSGLPQLRRRLAAVDRATGRTLMQNIQVDAVAEAKRIVPRKTSRLGGSIVRGGLSDDHAIVKATAGYAAHVEFGTRPHVIRPKRKSMLAWPANSGDRRLSGAARRNVKGGWIRAKEVHHPGTKPQPYLVPGARKAIKDHLGADAIIREWNGAA